MKKIYLALIISVIFNFNSSFKAQSEIWGLTTSGADGYGTLFGLPTGNTAITTQYTFPGSPGSSPQHTKMIETVFNGKLYGLTNTGGANNLGVLFEYDKNTNTYTRKVDFSAALGSGPRGGLLEVSGKLYGMTEFGGAFSLGVVFEYDLATGVYTKKVDLDGTIGARPYGTLMKASNNKLYGVTRFGGTANAGVIFEYDIAGNTYTKKFDFTTGVAGSGTQPYGELVEAANGNLYGLASSAAANNTGAIFEYDYVGNVYTKKFDFANGATTGSNPQGSLMRAANNKLYGMTLLNGANSAGTIFEYDAATNTFTKLYDLLGTTGSAPAGSLVQAANGKFYGMTRLGGAGAPTGGVIFEFDPVGNVYTKKFDFVNNSAATGGSPFGSLVIANNGRLYGLTSNGGAGLGGVLFEYDITGSAFTKKIDLNTSNGGQANGHLILANNGKLYGMAATGGTNNVGVIFEYDKTTNTFTKKIDLSSTTGNTPFGSLVQATNNKLYGLTSAGGTGLVGTLFEYDISTNTLTKRVDFTGNAGGAPGGVPYGSLIQASNGKLYGITKQGGVNGLGVIFEFDPTTNIYTKKYDMLAANGYSAYGSLMEASNGKLYGLTSLGGANGLGVIFEFDITTNGYTKVDFNGTNGSQPFGSLVESSTGILHGLTKLGGTNAQGVLFEYNIGTSALTNKVDLSIAGGAQPLGSLIRAANGNLYGVTNQGGANLQGALFEYNIAGNVYTKKIDFNGTNGSFPGYTKLLEVCTLPLTPGAITSSSTTICQGSSSTRNYDISSVANATSYTWTVPVGASILSGSNTINISASLSGLSAGIYTIGVAGVNLCGTGTMSTTNFTVHALPTVTVNSGSICSGKQFTIVPGGANTYTVQGNLLVVSPSSNTSYTVAGTSVFGCVSSNTPVSNVVVNALPTVSVNSGAICLGKSFTITPTGVTSFTIVPGNVQIVSPTSNTTYAVYGVDGNGCASSNTAISTITVNALPVMSLNSGSICVGQNHTFTPCCVSTFTIEGNTTVVSPSVSKSYTVIGTDANGCVTAFPASANVTVHTLPTLTLNSGTICAGQNHTFTPCCSSTFTILPGNATVVSPPVGNTVYSVTGRSAEGCLSAAPAFATVTVNSLPAVSLNSGTLCAGQTHTFVQCCTTNYTIYPLGTTTLVTPPVGVNTYSLLGRSAQGCYSSSMAVAGVTVHALPSVSVNSGSICAGQSFTITPSSSIGGSSFNVSPGGVTVVSPSGNISYSVTATSPLGCVSPSFATSSVLVSPLPVIAASNGTICAGEVFTTTVSGASTYTYTDGPNSVVANGSTTLSPLVTTSYSVTGTSSVGCISGNPVTVMGLTVNPLPLVSISGASAICEGSATTLTASGANTYNWGTSTNTVITVNPLVSTTYSVTGTDGNGCSNFTTFPLTVNLLPTVTIISGAICPGNSYTFNPTGASTYTFMGGGSNIVSPTVTTTYSVVGTSIEGCVSSTTAVATVSVVNILTVTISGNTSICNGGTVNLVANGASTYSWNTGAATNTLTESPTANTGYTVVGSSGTCKDTAFVSVIVNPLPNVVITATPSSICVTEVVTLSVTGANSYSWSTQQGGSSITDTPTITTTYTIVGVDANNCSNTAAFTVTVDACVGIVQNAKNSAHYSIYPNPNSGEFFIETTEAIKIMVVNALGQTIIKQQLNEGKNSIDLTKEAKGIYFVTIQQGNQTKSLKVIKQ